MADLSAQHYLRIYRIKLALAEDGTTHPSTETVDSMRRLVASLTALEADSPVRLEVVESTARFTDVVTGRVLAELRWAADA